MEKEIQGTRYILDENRIKELELPYFMEEAKTMWYAVSDKPVYVPARFQFSKSSEGIVLRGSLVLPVRYHISSAKTEIQADDFMDILIHAVENGKGLHKDPYIQRCCRAIQMALYRTLATATSDFIMLGQKYDYPAFVFAGGKIIGIAPETIFHDENGILVVSMHETIGTYLTHFRKYGKSEISILVLDRENEPLLQLAANAERVSGQTLIAKRAKTATIAKETIMKCQEIQDTYSDNYYRYFLERGEAA